jgi:ribosomal protein L11 methyltransferase
MEQVISDLKQYSDVIGEGTVTVEETEDVDWINNWKQYFHQFWIDDILAIPSWEKPEITDKKPALIFHIDPGTAFGTGMHETTQLCIRQIRKYLTPDTVMLDVGTGSGILAILALMFGIKSAVGTDLDPCAPPAIEDNLRTNGVDPSKFQVILGNLIDDEKVQEQVGTERYDIVAANILADVLIPLTPHVVPAMKPGAYYITSGILEGREDSVAEAMREAGLEVISVTAQGEWRCVVGRKPL